MNKWIVILLSDWATKSRQSLLERINKILDRSLISSVLIVDNLTPENTQDAQIQHQAFLSSLIQAGGNVLFPHSQEEIEMIQKNPVEFAIDQIRKYCGEIKEYTLDGLIPPVSFPEGYKEFSKAFTRLSPEEINNLISGKRSGEII